ncbi:MAG: hypothetical protein JZU47_08040 [Prolixibacteraceae bacterium]|nr:hypothetical protein [Prolixibacteraceae bacterium]
MENFYDKIDEVLSKHTLRCYRSGCSGHKILIAGIEGSGFDFALYFTWNGEINITKFEGSAKVSDFCQMLIELDGELKNLHL